MKIASFFDTKGKLYIDCTECTRGYYGNAEHKCCAGWKYKRKNKSGCFIGTLMPEYEKAVDGLKQKFIRENHV